MKMSPEMSEELAEYGEDYRLPDETGRPPLGDWCFSSIQDVASRASASRPRHPTTPSAIRILCLELLVNELGKRNQELSRRIGKLETVPQPLLVPINTFAPRPFEPTTQILVVVEPIADESGEPCEYVATFVDGSVSVTGDTVEEAVSLLKSRMVSQFNLLTKLPPERLGRIPQQQLAALKAVMRRTE